MKNNFSILYACFLIIGDFLAVLAAFVAAYILRVKFDPRPLIEQIPALTYFTVFASVLPLWILVHAVIGLYTQDIYEKRLKELGRLFMGSFVGILVIIGFDFVVEDEIFPARLVPVYGVLLSFGFLVLFRTIARSIRRQLFRVGWGVSNILIIGKGHATRELVDLIKQTNVTGLRLVGSVGLDLEVAPSYEDFQEAITSLSQPIHGIVQTELYTAQEKNNEVVRYAHENHVAYRFIPGNSELFVGKIAVELFGDIPVVAVHQTALLGWGRLAKRLFDLVVATTALFFLWPFFAVIALIQKILDPKGPVFLRQTRLTRFNREFRVYKFRTHRSDISGISDEEAFEKLGKPELYEQYIKNDYVLENDPRITRFGKFMRLTSIDELPQFINVLLGDVSLVGPRALIPSELNTYLKKHTILSVKSGMTGLAQVSGRESLGFEERRKLDVFYVQNWTFWLDISILIRTIRTVLTGSGAK